jgi:hypothetical protein
MTPRSRPLTSWDIERQQDRQDLDDDALPMFNPDASAGSIMHATETRTSTNTNVKINNYIMWDVKKGGSSSEKAKAKEKPENSTNSGEAWEWFKTTNIPLRDAALAMGGNLGPLTNAITAKKQMALAAKMVDEPEVRPRTNMSEKEINRWVATCRAEGFLWFRTLSDELLVLLMNRLNASVNPAPFFRMKLAADLPALKEGELYYPVDEFQLHTEEWVTKLNALVVAGWNENTANLKEVFMASIESCKVLHAQAKREVHSDVHRLIAVLQKWLIKQDNEVQIQIAAKTQVKADTSGSAAESKGGSLQKQMEQLQKENKAVRAMFTAMTEAGGGSASKKKSKKAAALVTDTKEEGTKAMYKCCHCGNNWADVGKPVRCRDVECVYIEHKDYKASKSAWPENKAALTWRAYGQPYPPKQQAYFDRKDKLKGGIKKEQWKKKE